MDNDLNKKDVNNTSTQKTVRLKPLVKQPLVGDSGTESQSVKKVSTNSGAFPKVGTQTGRISSIATNTARVVRINSAIRASSNAAGPSTTMMDFKTSELQMASPGQPNTTRPAAAPKSVLNSLNLKPKVAEASVVETAPAADGDDTQTAAIPKAPAPVKPNIKLSTTPPPLSMAAKPVIPATPAAPAAPAEPELKTYATVAPEANSADDTQTAAVAKPAPAKPVINLNSKPIIPSVPAAVSSSANPTVPAAPVTAVTQESDDATVKLKRPEKTGTSHTNSVVPNITSAPKISVPTPAAAPNVVKPSQAPTVKFNLKNNDAETVKFPNVSAPTVPEISSPAAAPEDAKPKLGLKKAEEPAPAAEAKAEEKPAEEALKADEKAEPKKAKKKKSVAAAAAAGASSANKKSAKAASASKSELYGFHFSVSFLTAIALIAAATLCWVQYLNTYKPQVFGKYIQIPFMEQVGK